MASQAQVRLVPCAAAAGLKRPGALAAALLDFQSPADLATWLAAKLPNRIE